MGEALAVGHPFAGDAVQFLDDPAVALRQAGPAISGEKIGARLDEILKFWFRRRRSPVEPRETGHRIRGYGRPPAPEEGVAVGRDGSCVERDGSQNGFFANRNESLLPGETE